MQTTPFLSLLCVALMILQPSDSKILPWSTDYSKATTFPPESFGNLRELVGEFDGWDRLAEMNGWETVSGNVSGNGTELGADDNPLECVIRFETNSCYNSCGEFRSFYCSCDEFCHIYHSCCNDYEKTCPAESESSLIRYSKYIGAPIECIALDDGYYVISGCPETANATLSQNCSESKAEPMSVIDTGIHFKNSFCLQCFDVKAPVEKWKTSIGIIRRGKRSAKSYDLSRLFRSQATTSTSTWEFTSKYLSRQCVPGAINRCPKNSPIKLQRLCEYTRHPFKLQYKGSSNLELYENEFCADCHSRFLRNISHCSYMGPEFFKERHPSFKMLMSVESPDNIVITTSHELSPFTWVKIKCTSMVDEVPTDCQIVNCRDTHEVADGKCVAKKIQYSQCFLLNFLIKKDQADHLDFDKFVNDIFSVTDEFLKAVNFTYQNYTVDNVTLPMSGDVRIVLRYDLMRKWSPDINVFNSYVDYFESRKDIFGLNGDVCICTNPLDNVMCSSTVSCFTQSHKKTVRLGGYNETSIAMARPDASANCHNVFLALFVVLVIC